MNCAVHPDTEASWYCRNCGKPMCEACSRKVRDVVYCEPCLAQQLGVPEPASTQAPAVGAAPGGYVAPLPVGAKKTGGSPVLAFLLGFIPGLGAVYNGEYNKALLHLLIMAGIILGLTGTFGDDLTEFWVVALIVFVFYMAIDALRVARAKENPTEAVVATTSDPIANWSQNKALGPYVLIGIGGLILLHNFGFFEELHLRRIFWPVLLIGIGFLMLRNRMAGRS